MKLRYLIALFPLSLFAEENISGNINNSSGIVLDTTGSLSNKTTLTINGLWENDKSKIEFSIIANQSLQNSNPLGMYRDSSVVGMMMEQTISTLPQEILDPTKTPTLIALFGEMNLLGNQNGNNGFEYLPYTSYYPNNSIALNLASVKMFFPIMDITVGRQVIAWGTGYAFNPTDIWNTKNPMDAEASKMGINAVDALIAFGDLATAEIVLAPGIDTKHSSGGIRAKSYVAGSDISLSFVSFQTSDREIMGLPRKVICGADFVGQIWDIGISSEVAVTNPIYKDYLTFDSLYTQFDLGVNYTFENGAYVMAEYLYNSLASGDNNNLKTSDLIHLFSGDMSGIKNHYIFTGIRKSVLSEEFALSLFSIYGASDNSALLMPSVSYNFSDNISIKLDMLLTLGDRKGSEYGSMKHNGSLGVEAFF